MLGAWGNPQFGRSFSLDLMGIAPEDLRPGHVEFADHARTQQKASLAKSDLFLADPDMVDLLDAAAPTMPDQELDLRELLAPRGFLWFEKPLPDRSDVPPAVPIRALAWTRVEPDDPLWGERVTGTPGVLITSYVKALDMARARQPGVEVELAPGAPGLCPSATVMWAEGSLIGAAFGEVPDDPQFAPGFYQRVAAAFWTLARQPLTTTEAATPGDRPLRRRAARAGVENPNQPVQVIRLRSHEGSHHAQAGESGTGRKVSVRFAVRGHWRRQWLPSTESHRQQWIAPYVKGPEDAPFKGGERVFLTEGEPRRRRGDEQK